MTCCLVLRVRSDIVRNARIQIIGEYQSCMESKLRFLSERNIWTRRESIGTYSRSSCQPHTTAIALYNTLVLRCTSNILHRSSYM